jgi:hypothetical protein
LPHFDIPLDLPHASRLAERIRTLLAAHFEDEELDAPEVMEAAERLSEILDPFSESDENPPEPEALRVREEAAAAARALVDVLEAAHITGDRLGQYVRNVFECLELGEEGSRLSLRAGENPGSLQRPT